METYSDVAHSLQGLLRQCPKNLRWIEVEFRINYGELRYKRSDLGLEGREWSEHESECGLIIVVTS